MRLFIDTANINEIREANALGIIDGVTTNPTLIAKEGRDFITVVKEICSIVDGPISAGDKFEIRRDGKRGQDAGEDT